MKRIIYISILVFFSIGFLVSQPTKGLENLIETAKLIGEKEEEPLVKTIAHFQSELSRFDTIEQAIVNSMIAECLWSYLQQNRYEIFARTPIVNPDMTDVRTWDTRLLLQQCIDYYKASLRPRELLQNRRVRDYKAILELGSDESEIQRPTLFDLLAFRAINVWSSEDLRLTQPQDGFIVDNPQYLSQSGMFKTLDIPTMDTFSLDYQILKTYQILCQFHTQNSKAEILIPLDLQRLAWVRKKAVFEHADSLYQLALQEYLLIYPEHEATAQLYWALAEFHNELGNRYNNLVSEDYKWDKKTALDYAGILLERYAQTPFATSAKALLGQVQQPKISLQMQEVVLPDQYNLYLMRYANTDTIYFSLYRLSEEDLKSSDFLDDRSVFFTKLASKQTFFKQWKTAISNPDDYQNHRIELSLSPLPVGYYVLFASPDKNISANQIDLEAQFFGVSELALVSNSVGEKLEGLVLNRRTGKPLSGVNVRLFSRTYDNQSRQRKTTELAQLTSLKNGRFEYLKSARNESVLIELSYKSDVLLSQNYTHYLYDNNANVPIKARKQMFLFTDRAVYRPGQTVYFKGILIEWQGDEKRLLTDISTTVKLFDANYKEVSAIQVKTNEYGSFSGQFILPSKGLNGQYYLQNESGNCYFSVEEYKRPSFEIVFEPLSDAYQLDKDVVVSGVAKTYSGAGLGQSTVKYKVTRLAQFPVWRKVMQFRPPTEETVITQGEAVSDENGRFAISFTAFSDTRVSASQNPIYTFTVTADVTDVSGETQQAVQRIPVSKKALNVSLNVKSYMDKTKDSVLQIVSTNLSGEKMPSKGTIKIYRLIPEKRLLRDRLWEVPDQFELSEPEFSKRFPNDPYSDEHTLEKRDKELGFEKFYDTDNDSVVVLEGLHVWPSGEYFYVIETVDTFGNLVNGVNIFTIYAPKTDREPLEEFHYVILPKNTFEPGDKASWLIGTASKLTVFYEIKNEKGVLERQQISLANEQKRIEFPIKEEHRGNLSLQIWCVKENRVYNTVQTIFVPFSNKDITLTFETFRDKLTPNAQENWTLNLLSNDQKPLKGELLLSMYDASLDVFRKNYWNMDLNRYFHASQLWQSINFQMQPSQQIKHPESFSIFVPMIRYDKLKFEPPYFSRVMPMMRKGPMMLSGVKHESIAKDETGLGYENADAAATVQNVAMSVKSEESKTLNAIIPRTNLNETAFFYPFLRSDESGKISISFTVPESLTRWRIQGLAHTQDLKTGLNEWSALTQKNVMLYPNMPRFLREGDQINIQAKIVNLSNEPISGKATVVIDEKNTLPASSFSIAAQQNTSVNWPYRAGLPGLLSLKFLAEAGTHTDGEMQWLPVLSNRALLTETMPMFALPKSEQKFSFAKLAKPNSKTLENYRLTLEVATNPVWFAVQALPTLSNPNGDNSIAVFGAYFANAMAMNILEQNPKIKDVFNRWKTSASETLKSNLETNEDLKSVVLEETPWVLDAESETRQKQNIALYFDENNVKILQSGLLAKVKKMQLSNGGFAWYPGGRDDLWCTQYVVQGLQKMHRRNIERENFELQDILRQALKYCDEQHVKRYQQTNTVGAKHVLPQQGQQADISPNDIQYLYLRHYFSDTYPISSEMTEVLTYYDSLAKATWKKQSKYLQGVLALYFDLKNEKKFAQEVMQNLQRLALKSSEMGMYWRYEPSWFWYESAIETQSQLIETFSILGRSDDLALMKQWLLSQKRTTRWSTPKSSVDAVYALLVNTPNLEENTGVDIQVGDEKISTPATADAGSGYFTKFWTSDKMSSKQAQVTIKNQGNSMVWGGLYWQYFENLDRVTSAATPLSIKKTLYVERSTSDKSAPVVLDTIPAKGLNIGDKITVRIEIRADRDMDYVHLKDLRAAAFEPTEVRSGYRYQGGLSYYQDVKDVSMNFYFSHLPKGTYVFEYKLKASQIGDFSNGYTTIQCLYAPEFSAQSRGERIIVIEN